MVIRNLDASLEQVVRIERPHMGLWLCVKIFRTNFMHVVKEEQSEPYQLIAPKSSRTVPYQFSTQ